MTELTKNRSTDALWDAITWYAFVDGVMARLDGHDHVKGAYTIFAGAGLGGEEMAFSRPDSLDEPADEA